MGQPSEFERKRLEKFFEPQAARFKFEGTIAHGAYGVTFKMIEFGDVRSLPPPIQPLAPPARTATAPGQLVGTKRLRSITPTELVKGMESIARGIKRIRNATPPEAFQTIRRNLTPRARRVTGGVPEPQILRRLCLKRALGDEGIQPLRDEIRILREINGSMHIAGLVAFRDDERRVARQLAAKPFPRVDPGQGDFLAGLTGPVLVMEYIENGMLRRLIRRLENRAEPTPNRVLWAFYLCAVRACIGMAYPRQADPDAAVVLENIPIPEVEASTKVHGDLHTGNIMVGDFDLAVPEHSLVPVMKLIDFGLTTRVKESKKAVEENLFEASRAIYSVAIRQLRTQNDRTNTEKYKDIQTFAVRLSDEQPQDLTLDSDLRDLICRSMAKRPEDRFTLAQMLAKTSQPVANKTAASFMLNGTAESDDDIKDFVQDMIYNADPDPPAAPSAPAAAPAQAPPPPPPAAPIMIISS